MDIKLLQEQNRLLTEGKRRFWETFAGTVEKIVNESATPVANEIAIKAKISQCDRKNGNHRIYPTEVMALALRDAKERIKVGRFTGCLDHPSWSDGVMANTCIRWDDVWMDPDGGIYATGAILTKTEGGEQLETLMEAKVAIGFSTAGMASAHYPSEAERKRFGLSDDEDCVIIDDNYVMKRADAVDDPSCYDAWKENTGAKTSDNSNGSIDDPILENGNMKTLDELKQKFPELFALHTAAIAEAVTAATTPLTTKIKSLETTNVRINNFLDSIKADPNIEMPFKELSQAEANERITKIQSELDATKAQLADAKKSESEKVALEGKVVELTKKVTEAEEVAKQTARKNAVAEKQAALLTNNRFASRIEKEVAKAIEDPKFDVAALETFINEKTAEYEEVAGEQATSPYGIVRPPAAPAPTGGGSPDLKKQAEQVGQLLGI